MQSLKALGSIVVVDCIGSHLKAYKRCASEIRGFVDLEIKDITENMEKAIDAISFLT